MAHHIPPAPTMGAREWALLLTLAALWGGSFFFFKILVATLPPLTVVLGRVGLAALCLNLWLALHGTRLPAAPRLWAGFLVMGVLNNVIPFTLIAFGETRIASGLAAILNAATPLFTVLLAHAFTANEPLTRAKAAGVLVGFAGVAVLVGPGALAGLGRGDLAGTLACLGAAFAYAVAGVYGRRFRALPALQVATGQVTASTLVLLPLAAGFDRPWTLPTPDAATWGALAGIALLCTVAAYILYFRILATAGATNLLLVTFLIPVTALALGALVLHEALSPRALAGMAVIGLGLAAIDGRLWAAIRPHPRPRPRPAR